MKTCSKCKTAKPVGEFTRDRKRADGLNYYCRTCTRAANRKYQAENPEAAKERGRRWVQNNPERQRERTQKWKAENKERNDAWFRRYRKENAESINADQARRRAENPQYEKERAARYYAANKARALARWATREARKLQATPRWSRPDEIAAFYRTADALAMHTGQRYNVDHIVPLRHLLVCGLHCQQNLQLLTETENKSKGNRHWPDMPQ